MRKNLFTFIVCLLCSVSSWASLSFQSSLPALGAKPDMRVNHVAGTRADVEEPIDYSTFYFFIGPNNHMWSSYMLRPDEDGNENKFIVKNIPVHKNDVFMLQGWVGEGGWYYANAENVGPTSENPSCELYFTTAPFTWDPYYGLSGISAICDVVVEFEGEKVKLTFNKIEDLVLQPQYLSLISDSGNFGGEVSDPGKVVYKNVPVTDGWRFYFYDRFTFIELGWTEENLPPLTSDNLTTTVKIDPEYYVETKGLEGNYNITVEFNEDLTEARVSLSEYVVPDELARYSGDLYIYTSNYGFKNDQYKMTCTAPGVYEWSGDILASSFAINGGSDNAVVPDTDIRLWFGGLYSKPLVSGEPYQLRIDGDNLDYNINNRGLIARNVKMVLDLKTLTLTFTGEVERPVLDLQKFFLFQRHIYSGKVTGNEICYESIEMKSGDTMFIDAENWFRFGWAVDNENLPLSENNLETELYTNDNPDLVDGVKCDLNGEYDVYVTFNDAQTQAKMRLVKSNGAGVEAVGTDSIEYRHISGGVEIVNAREGEEISVYTLSGMPLFKTIAGGGTSVFIPLENGEPCILKVGSKSMKLMK